MEKGKSWRGATIPEPYHKSLVLNATLWQWQTAVKPFFFLTAGVPKFWANARASVPSSSRVSKATSVRAQDSTCAKASFARTELYAWPLSAPASGASRMSTRALCLCVNLHTRAYASCSNAAPVLSRQGGKVGDCCLTELVWMIILTLRHLKTVQGPYKALSISKTKNHFAIPIIWNLGYRMFPEIFTWNLTKGTLKTLAAHAFSICISVLVKRRHMWVQACVDVFVHLCMCTQIS